MNLLIVDEKIQCLKSLFSGSDSWMNSDFLSSSDDDSETYVGPIGINSSSPEARKPRLKSE
jgi:hypothetical protein